MRKTFQYRLYPSKAQERKLDATLETCRRWWNDLLAERKTAWDERQESIGKVAQLQRVKAHTVSNPWAAEVHSHVLQVVVADLDEAFQAFFRRVKAGDKAGYPRFTGRNRVHSFGRKELGNGFRLDGRRLEVSGIGRIAVRWHRPLEGTIKTLRMSRKAGHWYASFSVEYTLQPLPATGREVGIDMGIASLITMSDGAAVPPQHWYRCEQKKLRVLQRRVARRKLKGKNRHKAVVALQRQHERIANTRKDFLNKLTHRLIQDYDQIVVEDLRITNMVKNRHLAKSILDAGWGSFIGRLHSKAGCPLGAAGRVVVDVDPRFTSKTCSGCGHIFEQITRRDRWIDCACGLSLDRDHNAANTILNRAGHVRWALSSPRCGLAQEAVPLSRLRSCQRAQYSTKRPGPPRQSSDALMLDLA